MRGATRVHKRGGAQQGYIRGEGRNKGTLEGRALERRNKGTLEGRALEGPTRVH